jgi:hypothetical protein
MIKFAVTRPKERIASIRHGVGMLKWHDDPYLKHYGIQIEPQMTMVSCLFDFPYARLTQIRRKLEFCLHPKFSTLALLRSPATLVAGTYAARNSSTPIRSL